MKNRLSLALFIIVLALGLTVTAPAQAATAPGTLTVTATVVPSITFAFDATGNPLTGINNAVSPAVATLALGNVSRFGAVPSGFAFSSTATDYTLTAPIGIIVDGSGSVNYTLTAALSGAAAAGFSYAVGALVLTTSAQSVTATGSYSPSAVSRNLGVTITNATLPAGSVNKDVLFVATTN
jgi:hypothetical protein